MKTKHLFYSLALASAFTACTQEELVETPVVKDNVADRPVAGVVEFSTEGVESRFNYEKANGFQAGDVFGLYLMDEFVDGKTYNGHDAEHADANGTWWRYQDHWFGMYRFTNNIQSNYPFTYGDGVWTNDAKLVEGNYFAMFPQNEKALNRRDLWHVIDPSVELKKVSSSTSDNLKYQNVENQFWLGYKQIYRDATASAEGVMTMSLDLTGVMVPLKFVINNNSNNDVIVDKISFKHSEGAALPTLAYVRPETTMEISKLNFGWVKTSYARGEYNCTTPGAYNFYNEDATWTKQTVQGIVDWTVPGVKGEYPYGLEGAAVNPAYEYSFTYPSDVKLAGNVNGGSLLTTYIVIPAMETGTDYNKIQVCIYGWQKDNSSATGWTYGMLTTTKGNDDDNYTFDLFDKYNYWTEQAEETNYYREVNVKFSEFAWKAVNASQVASTTDMENMVLSFLSQNSGNQTITIAPDKNGVEVTSEFVNKLYNDSKNKGREITLNFSGTRGGVVTFNDNETMDVSYLSTETKDYLKLKYSDGIKLVNNGVQTVSGTIDAPIENNGTLNVITTGHLGNVVTNYNKMTVGSNDSNHGGYVYTIDNYGELTLKELADVTTLNNDVDGVVGKVVVDAYHASYCKNYAEVEEFNNKYDHGCSTCLPSELTAKTGTLKVTTLTNNAKLTVDAGAAIEVKGQLTNNMHNEGWIDGWTDVYAMTINGTINGAGQVTNNGIIDNYGTLNSATVENNYVINGYKGKVRNLANGEAGIVYIKSEVFGLESKSNSCGKFIFEGVTNQHIGTAGTDVRIFQTVADIKGSEIDEMMNVTKITQLWLSHNLTVDYNEAGNKSLWTEANRELIEYVKVNAYKNVTIKGEKQNKMLTLKNADVVVDHTAELNIENALQMTVNSFSGNIDLGTGSSLKNENGEDLNDVNHNPDNVVEVTINANATAAENGKAMETALAAASEGDYVTLPAGTFSFDKQFNLKSVGGHSNAVSIIGEEGTIIKGNQAKVLYFTLSDESSNLYLKNITVESSWNLTTQNPNDIWIRPDYCSEGKEVNIVLENVTCKSLMLEPYYVDGITYNVTLKNCNIEKVNAHAFSDSKYTTWNNVKYDENCNVTVVPGGSAEQNVTVTKI